MTSHDPTDEKPNGDAGEVTPIDTPDIPVEIDDQKTTPVPAVSSADEKIATLEKEKKDLYERMLRSAADLDNFRKRTRKDMDEARLKSKEEVLREVLPVVDNLERAISAAGDASGPIGDGVKLVLRQLMNALERFEVKAFTAVGEAFDPSRHEAIAQVATSERPPGTIHTEMQKGYMIGARLLRPALVAVAKAPPPPVEAANEAVPAEAPPPTPPEEPKADGGLE